MEIGAGSTELQPRLLQRLLENQLEQTQDGVLSALEVLLDLKHLKTGIAARKLAQLAVNVAENLGLEGEDLRSVQIASVLYDIGKVGIPDEVLQSGRLPDGDQTTVLEKHPEYGWCILRMIHGFKQASLLVLHHQEWFDGGGYPAGLKGDEIPLGSRIVAVVDAFDALVSDRPDSDHLSWDEAFERLRSATGTQFDPLVVDRFVAVATESLEYFEQLS